MTSPVPLSESTSIPSPFPLMELSSGFFAAKTLSVAVRMELFALVAEQGGLTVDEFAAERALHPRPAEMLLTGCTSLGLLVKDGPRYTNSPLSQPAGGRIIISELLMDDDKTGPVPAALFNLLMLVETERGWNYTGAEYAQWLTEAGCTQVVHVEVPGISANGVVVGTV